MRGLLSLRWTRVAVVLVIVVAVAGLLVVVSPNRHDDASGPTNSTTAVTASVITTVLTATTSTTLAATVVPAEMLNPAVTQATIMTTICVSGYTQSIRPTSSVTDRLKARQITAYAYANLSASAYEEDHVVALGLGGSPATPANLWPEPQSFSGADDRLENDLHVQVCAGRLDLLVAQLRLLEAKIAHGYRREPSVG